MRFHALPIVTAALLTAVLMASPTGAIPALANEPIQSSVSSAHARGTESPAEAGELAQTGEAQPPQAPDGEASGHQPAAPDPSSIADERQDRGSLTSPTADAGAAATAVGGPGVAEGEKAAPADAGVADKGVPAAAGPEAREGEQGEPPAVDATPGAGDSGPAPAAPAATASGGAAAAQNVYRLYNPYSGEHLYTADLAEARGLVGMGWAWEGVGWVSPTSSGDPVLRLYNPYNGEHLYTLSEREASRLASLGWRREGTAWSSGGPKGVLREFNPYATVGTHNYTLSASEDGHLASLGWRREGVAWSSLDRAPLPVRPFWAAGPSGRWWVQRDGSYAAGRVIEPGEDGAPGVRAYATAGNGHVVRGAEVVGGRTVVADASTGALPASVGWWESSAPTGSVRRYMISMGPGGVPYARTGRFEDGGSAYYGVPGRGYVAVGRERVGNVFVLTDAKGRLNESTGYIWFRAADDSSTCLYRMGNYGPNGLVGARADGFFTEGGNRFYANPSSGRLNRSGVFYADGAWWRAVDWGGCFSCGSWQDMAAKAQGYQSATSYLILVDCWSNRVAVYQWDNGWFAVQEWSCTTGANNCTVKGEFSTNLKGYSFGRGFTCYYYTQFYGDYLFHSVLYYQNSNRVMDGRLGINASHGCVRLAIENAKWIYDVIPRGTKVVTY